MRILALLTRPVKMIHGRLINAVQISAALIIAALITPAEAQQAPAAPAVTPAPGTSGDGRIIGGVNVLAGEAPWMVEIFYKDNISARTIKSDSKLEASNDPRSLLYKDRPNWDRNHFCGAVLIARNWALTALHCIQDVEDQTPPEHYEAVFKRDMRLRLGTTSIRGHAGMVCNPLHVVMATPANTDTSANPSHGDIALIHFNQSACVPHARRGSVAPIRIGGLSDNDLLLANYRPGAVGFTVFGWGMVKPREAGAISVVTKASPQDVNRRFLDPNSPDLLKAGPLNFVDHAPCASAYQAWPGEVTPATICADVGSGKKGQCDGDSGGPLVYYNDVPTGGQVVLLIGLVHGGLGCGLPDTPGIFEYVPGHLDWIEQTIGNGDATQGKRLLVQPQAGT